MGTRPHWTYNYQIWCEGCRRRRNHWWQILSRSVKGFSVCGGPKMGVFHWLELSPLQQVSTTVLPVTTELFSLSLTVETLYAEICRSRRFSKGVGHFECKFQTKGCVAHQPLLASENYTMSQKTVQICFCQNIVKFPPICSKRITVPVKIVSEFMYQLPKNRMVAKCPVCGLSGLCRKCDATFAASWEYVTVQVLKELKCAFVCYSQGRIFDPTNLLNHVAPSTELMMQMWVI